MSNCPNCKVALGCSCKLRTAADGKQCCTSCVDNYNTGVKKPATKNSNQKTDAQAPTNVSVVYKGPGKQVS